MDKAVSVLNAKRFATKERRQKMRLLYCDFCATMEEVPDYDGDQEVDPFVEAIVFKHNERDAMAHGGDHLKASPIRIFVVEDEEWRTKREKVITHINEMNKKVGMTAWVDGVFNTFADDALRCYREHHRPAEGCIDYWDSSKRLGRPTKEGRLKVKENYKLGKGDPHLCQFCPVHSYVEMQQRNKAGLYK